jgi:hypothetical protein
MDALRRLDVRLEGLTLEEPTSWPLEELAAEYRRLKETEPAAGRQIEVRLAQISRMKMVRKHYGDYVRLTSATDERDAALLARSVSHSPRPVVQAGFESGGPKLTPPMRLAVLPDGAASALPPPAPPAEPTPAVNGGPPFATKGSLAATSPQRAVPAAASEVRAAIPPQSAPEAALPTAPPSAARRFDAVGVIQKAVDPPPEAPGHVLVAPNGRILMYLSEQPGISLDPFVGQAMGVDGERHRHPELSTPMIVVGRLTPVRL